MLMDNVMKKLMIMIKVTFDHTLAQLNVKFMLKYYSYMLLYLLNEVVHDSTFLHVQINHTKSSFERTRSIC